MSSCAWNDTYARNYVKMHVSASILVNTVALRLLKLRQTIEKEMYV